MKYNIVVLGLVCFVVLAGCTKSRDILKIPIDGEYAVPLFKSRNLVSNLTNKGLADGILSINTDGTVSLKFSGEATANTAVDFFKLLNVIPFPDSVIQMDAYNEQYKVRVDTLMLKSGTMTVIINNTYNSSPNGTPVPFTLYLPQWKKDGVPFQKDFVAPFGQSYALTFDISDYSIVPVNGKFYARYKAVNDLGQQVKFDGFILSANNTAVTRYAQGSIGYQVSPPYRDTIDISVFDWFPEGSIQFADPRLTVTCNNSWGVPVKVVVTEASWSLKNGQTQFLQSQITDPTNPDNGININYPTLAQAGQSVLTTYEFNRNNSNIHEITSSKPVRLTYQAYAISNATNDLSIACFVFDSSRLNTRFDLELPLYGSVANLSFLDTIPIDLSQNGSIEVDDVLSVELKVKTLNSLPLEYSIDLIGLDEFYQPLGSFTGGYQQFAAAPEMDAEGYSIAPASQTVFFELDNKTLKDIFTAKYVLLKTVLNTSAHGEKDVRIRSNDYIHFDCGAKIRFKSE